MSDDSEAKAYREGLSHGSPVMPNNREKFAEDTPPPSPQMVGSDKCVEEACPSCGGSGRYGDAARRAIDGEITDQLSEVTKERDHFYNQWRSCGAPLTPKSEEEKSGFERALAILKSKLSDGGGIVGPSEVQRAHNDFYRGRRVAFEECATMLRAALATAAEGSGE